MKIKNNKGVTLIILTVMIAVIIMISGITITEGLKLIDIKKLNLMNSDIEIISTELTNYYLKNESLPSKGEYYDKNTLIIQFGGEEYLNPNDGDNYFVIDLTKLDNLTLNYGRDYAKWNDRTDSGTCKDLYIANEVTLQVYYVKGITTNENKYYTKLKN